MICSILVGAEVNMGILTWLKAKWARSKVDTVGMDDARAARPASAVEKLDGCSAAARLAIEFERLQENRITLDGYESLVNRVFDDVRVEMADIIKSWREMDSDQFSYEMDRLEVDREECLWWLTWIGDFRRRLKRSSATA